MMRPPHTHCLLSLLAAVLLPSLGTAQDTAVSSALDKAEVRIPYLELRKLWETAQAAAKPAELEAPPHGALLSAQFKADLTGGKVALEADFKVESFSGKWERIRLMGAGLAVASVEPADARLVVEDEHLCVMAKDPGPLTVKVRFVKTALPVSSIVPVLKLTTAPSAVASLLVTGLPEGRLVKTESGILAVDAAGNSSLPLAAKGGELALTLADASLMPKAEPPPPPPQPSEWSLQNEVLVFEGESELNYRARVRAIAQNGSALEAVLLLPTNARTVKVQGDDLADSRQARNADGQTELRVRWNTRDITERELKLSYALQQLPLAQQWELRAPSLSQDDKVKSLFILVLPSGMEFKGPSLEGPVPAARLPRWIADETKALEFGTIAGNAAVSLQSRLLPRLETAVAIISKSEYTTKLVGDGSVLTEGTLDIEHDDSLRWSFTLPDKCELLKCFVNGAPTKPIARENAVMEIPLTGAKATTSKVVFSYTCAKGKLHAVEGETSLELPLTPVFIQELLWSVAIPESYEPVGVEGNVEFATSTVSNASDVRLVKRLCRNERPQAQLFYRKRGIE
jgi:hypothetical protein